jgi:hypothetical protein
VTTASDVIRSSPVLLAALCDVYDAARRGAQPERRPLSAIAREPEEGKSL